MTEDCEKYWKNKIENVAMISKEHGYPEYDTGFWKGQVAGVISLISDLAMSRRDCDTCSSRFLPYQYLCFNCDADCSNWSDTHRSDEE